MLVTKEDMRVTESSLGMKLFAPFELVKGYLGQSLKVMTHLDDAGELESFLEGAQVGERVNVRMLRVCYEEASGYLLSQYVRKELVVSHVASDGKTVLLTCSLSDNARFSFRGKAMDLPSLPGRQLSIIPALLLPEDGAGAAGSGEVLTGLYFEGSVVTAKNLLLFREEHWESFGHLLGDGGKSAKRHHEYWIPEGKRYSDLEAKYVKCAFDGVDFMTTPYMWAQGEDE